MLLSYVFLSSTVLLLLAFIIANFNKKIFFTSMTIICLTVITTCWNINVYVASNVADISTIVSNYILSLDSNTENPCKTIREYITCNFNYDGVRCAITEDGYEITYYDSSVGREVTFYVKENEKDV